MSEEDAIDRLVKHVYYEYKSNSLSQLSNYCARNMFTLQ
jgi:hypothetical protein